jgi:hypothetical protein
MPKDPIWVDTCTLIFIYKGDFALELELKSLRAQGHELFIVPWVRHELMQGNPLTASPAKPQWEQVPSEADQREVARMMNRLGIKVDLASNQVGMTSRVHLAFQDHLPQHSEHDIRRVEERERRKGRTGENARLLPRGVSKYLGDVQESDAQVLAQIKRSAEVRGIAKPTVFTSEEGAKAMFSKSHLFGVTSIRRKTPKPPMGGGGKGGGGGGPPGVPKLNVSEYPADKELPIVRFFKDRPVLRQVGLTAASNAVEFFQMVLSDYIQAHCGGANADLCTAMTETLNPSISIPLLPRIPNPRQLVESHFDEALMNAYKEFAVKFPDIRSLSTDLRLDQCRAAYNAALAKLKEPSGAQVAAATMVLLTPPQDRAAFWQAAQQRLSTVKLASGAIGGYGQAAAAYIEAMAELMTRLVRHGRGLPEIGDEIGRRSEALERAGDETEQAFQMLLPFAMPVPLGFYALTDLHIWAATFTRYGESVGALSAELHGRADEYERMRDTLDKELIKVSEEMNRYVP